MNKNELYYPIKTCTLPNMLLSLCSCDRASSVKRGERIPTRCNNIDAYCQFRCLILTTVSTCFGHLYAHHQEKKDHVLLHMGLYAGSVGCGWLRYCGATL